MEKSYTIKVDPGAVVRVLLALALLLSAVSIFGQFIEIRTGHGYLFGLIPKTDLDLENNIPTFFSSSALLISSALLMLVAFGKRRENDPFFLHWAVLAAGIFLMSLDETASLHDLFTTQLRKLFSFGGPLYFPWVVVAIPLVALIGSFYVRFLAHLSRETRFRFLCAALLYLGGAIGMEMVGAAYAESHGEGNMTYVIIVHVEEILEMFGIIFLIGSVLRYIEESGLSFTLRPESSRGIRPPSDCGPGQ